MTLVPMPAPQLGAARPTWIEVMDRGSELAEVIANTDFVPRGLRGNQPAILAAILYGHEVGLEPMQSLAKIAVIDGKPSLSAEAQRALILAAGHELWVEDSTNTRAVVAGRRRDGKQTSRVTWTLDDAKRARIAGKQNWQAYPRQMLVARASAELARQLFADVIGGMMATEELEDVVDDAGAATSTEPQPETKPTTRRRRRTASASPPQADPPPLPGEGEGVSPDPPTPDPGADAPVETIAGPAPFEPPVDEAPPDPPNEAQMRLLFALFNEKGMGEREERLAWSEKTLGRTISSSTELSALDASRLIEALQGEPDAALPADEQAVIDEAKATFDATEVPAEPPLPGEGGD